MNKYHLILLISVTISAISQLLMKKGAMSVQKNWLSVYLNVFTVSGYALLFSTTLINLYVFKFVELSSIVFFLPLTYIVIGLFSFVIFKEKITINTIIASLLIILGIVIYYL